MQTYINFLNMKRYFAMNKIIETNTTSENLKANK